jgi:transposase-like protein
MQCKKCGGTNTVKNGRTSSGQQKYHCRDCGVHTVTDDRARDRAAKQELVAQLHRENVSQRGIARVTGVARPTIKRWLSKSDSPAEHEATED